jgi:hypothetical protein
MLYPVYGATAIVILLAINLVAELNDAPMLDEYIRYLNREYAT